MNTVSNSLFVLQVQSISGTPSVQASTAISFKRPQPPTDLSNGMECKRRKQDDSSDQLSPLTSNASTTTGEKIRAPLVQKQMSAPEVNTSQTIKPKIQRSHSESHVSIMKALNKSCKYHMPKKSVRFKMLKYFLKVSFLIDLRIF